MTSNLNKALAWNSDLTLLSILKVMGAVTGEEKGTEPMLIMELMDHGYV